MQKFVDPFCFHDPSDGRFQESLQAGQSTHRPIRAGSQPPLDMMEHPVTSQQEDHQMVDETTSQSQATSPALDGLVHSRAGLPTNAESRQSSTAPHSPNEDRHNIGGGLPPGSESRNTTPRPRLHWKGKGRVVYSDDEEEIGEGSRRLPTPQAQEAPEPRQVSLVALRLPSRHNSFP